MNRAVFARKMTQDHDRPTAPPTIIVLTNYAFPEFETACRAAGADYFFDKSTQVGAVKLLLQSIRRGAH